MSEDDEPAIDAIAVLVPALLEALAKLQTIARHLDPAGRLILLASAAPEAAKLRRALDPCRAGPWPEPLAVMRAHLLAAGDAAVRAFDELSAAETGGLRDAYRALRHATRAEAALYPVASVMPSVSRFYVEPDAIDADLRIEQLAQADPRRPDVGVMHTGDRPGERGGFSLYVPEDYDSSRPYPLVMALHGGSGNGGTFLWSWLRTARTRRAILIAPTALGDTWSLRGPELDSNNLEGILTHAQQRWNVDPSRRLLTGMSDGGTFALLSGLSESSPFTHLAPAATGFHPMLLEFAEPSRITGLPIYLVHGTLDWMFDIGRARGVARALAAAGADIVFRDIDDLSHVYPRDENGRILDWLDGKR